eukprot:UN26212
MCQIQKILSKLCNECPDKDKGKFIKESEKQKRDYVRAVNKYIKTDEYKEFELKAAKHFLVRKYAKRLGITKKSVKNFPRDPHRPKRPANPYGLYLVDKQKEYTHSTKKAPKLYN